MNSTAAAPALPGWRTLVITIRWRRRFVALVALSFMTGGIAYAMSLPTLYEGRAVVALVPRPSAQTGADDALAIAMPAYATEISSPAVLNDVALEYGVKAAELSDGLEVSFEPESTNLEIVTKLPSPADAAEIANALASVAIERSDEDSFVAGEVVVRALPDGDPDAPRRGLLGLASLGAGLISGVAVAVYSETTARRIRTPSDVVSASGLPIIGRIPRSRVFKTKPREALAHPDVGAAFRGLRASVLRSSALGDKPVIAVTSPGASDGKTIVASLLAESIARVGTRVLLIDANLYRPSLARTFKLDAHRALTAVIRRTIPLRDAIRKGWVDDLYVLPARADRDAGDLITARLPEVIAEALSHVKVVVIDAPPLIGSAEGRTISGMATGIVVVVRMGDTGAPLNDALLTLESVDSTVLGIVANAVPGNEETDFYYA